jgi:hypothetical protein
MFIKCLKCMVSKPSMSFAHGLLVGGPLGPFGGFRDRPQGNCDCILYPITLLRVYPILSLLALSRQAFARLSRA